MKKRILAAVMILTLAIGCMLSGCKSKEKVDKLVIAVMTSESNDGSVSNVYADLGKCIEEKTGIPVEVYEVGSYEAGIEALRTGKADMNLFSAFSYYLAKQRADIEPLVSMSLGGNSDSGNTVIITQADSDINSVEDLRGHSFAFVDPASTSGHIAPKYFLMQEFGVTASELETDIFSQVSFAGGHDSVAIGVANGQYEAGACVKMLLDMLIQSGMVTEDQFKIIAETSLEGNSSAMVIRSAIQDDVKQGVKEALLEYDNSEFFQSFMNSPDARFCEVDQEGLDSIEEVAIALDLSEEELLK